MIVTNSVQAYLEASRPQPDPLLGEMQAHGERDGIPIVVPEVGMLLALLARARGARRIVEVGTAIGVSTLYMARALPTARSSRSKSIRSAMKRHAITSRRRGSSIGLTCASRTPATLSELEGLFDMAFIDGVKAQYLNYFDLLLPLLGPGAVLAVDNVLASGTVADGHGNRQRSDEQVRGLRAFNRRLITDDRLTATITPVGDGVLIAIRKGEERA